jgi:hypothetical protein
MNATQTLTEKDFKLTRNGCWKLRGYTIRLRRAAGGAYAYFTRPGDNTEVRCSGTSEAFRLVLAELNDAQAKSDLVEVSKFLGDKLLGPDFGK